MLNFDIYIRNISLNLIQYNFKIKILSFFRSGNKIDLIDFLFYKI